jgi:K+-transporting ATPase ATPase A chain
MPILILLLFIAMPVLLSWPLGLFMTKVMNPSAKSGDGRMSILLRKTGGRMLDREQEWKGYLVSMLFFNVIMFGAVVLMLALQHVLPLNPDGKGPLEASLIFNTAASFVTNTNLQHYSGEVSMSYFSQLFALTWLQFVSAATGIACLTALARALAGNTLVGNFYRDMLRSTLFILLPLSVVVALLLVVGGVPMTLKGQPQPERLKGRCRPSPEDRWRPWWPSNSSAQTVEDFLAPTRRILSKIPPF